MKVSRRSRPNSTVAETTRVTGSHGLGDRGEAIPLALTDEAVDPNDGYLKCKNQGSEERHSSQRLLKPYRNAPNCFAHTAYFASAKWHECGEIKELS